VDIESKTILPVWSYRDDVDIFDYYLDSFDQALNNAVGDEQYLDLFKATNKYLGEDLYYIQTENIVTNEITDVKINHSIQEGSNMLLPFERLPKGYRAVIPISESKLIENATAGATVDEADIIWQMVDNKIEGAWLKDNRVDYTKSDVRIKLNSGVTEFRFPYPDRGRVADGLEWTGKGVDNDTNDLYISQDDQLMSPIVEKLYWEDTTELTAVHDITLFHTNLVDDGATAGKTIKESDTITMKPTRDSEVGIEFAWLYKFDNMELPIMCGTNKFQFPLFTKGDGKYPYTIPKDFCSDIALIDVPTSLQMCGCIGGDTIQTADWILKRNGECGVPTEGAWLKGATLKGAFGKLYDGGSTQSSFSGVFASGVRTPFLWEFDTIEADYVFNGYEHDAYCEYHNLDHISSVINPEPTEDFIGWEKCTCGAVHYSPAGNPTGEYDKYEEYYDVIYEDMGDMPFSQKTWVDSEGNDYKTSSNFGYFEYKGKEPDVGFGKGEWLTYEGQPLKLKEGKSYFYVRASFGGCEVKAPCYVVNSCKCNPDCDSPVWMKMIKNRNGDWEDTGEFTDLIFEAGSHYEYVRRSHRSYDFFAPDPTDEDENRRKWVKRSTPLPNFNINIPVYNSKPYWAKSNNVLGMEMGSSPFNKGVYLKTSQPEPSDMILYDDAYIRYNHVGCDPLVWKETLKFSVNIDKPATWKELRFKEYNPTLLQKILGCGKCDLVFDTDPRTCKVRENNCNAYFANIEVTNNDSTMVIRSPENCDGTTEIYYKAQKDFDWTTEVTLESMTEMNVETVDKFTSAKEPWKNLLNQDKAEIKVYEEKEKLKTKEELGMFDPRLVGLLKTECFNMNNTLKIKNG